MPGNTNIPIMPKMFWKPSMSAWPRGSFSWMPTSKTWERVALSTGEPTPVSAVVLAIVIAMSLQRAAFQHSRRSRHVTFTLLVLLLDRLHRRLGFQALAFACERFQPGLLPVAGHRALLEQVPALAPVAQRVAVSRRIDGQRRQAELVP